MNQSQREFSMSSKVDGDVVRIKMTGPMDENAVFSEMPVRQKVVIHLKEVTLLNSAGTLSWCKWLERLGGDVDIELVEVPVIMVKNFSTVKMIVSERCRVRSFYVPYYSDQTGARSVILAELGTHFTDDGRLCLPKVQGPAGEPMELDCVPELYFKFLTE